MAKSRFVLNRAGVRSLLKSEEMANICSKYAKDIATRAGEGYISDVYVGKNRVNAGVSTDSIKAMRSNAKHNTLLKAMK